MSRFDYVEYDQIAKVQQDYFKHEVEVLEKAIEQHKNGRAKALALTALEECYMWIGKMIRDDQVGRNNGSHIFDKCTCGHPKGDHIYDVGACRPGFVCPAKCEEYRTK